MFLYHKEMLELLSFGQTFSHLRCFAKGSGCSISFTLYTFISHNLGSSCFLSCVSWTWGTFEKKNNNKKLCSKRFHNKTFVPTSLRKNIFVFTGMRHKDLRIFQRKSIFDIFLPDLRARTLSLLFLGGNNLGFAKYRTLWKLSSRADVNVWVMCEQCESRVVHLKCVGRSGPLGPPWICP